MTAAADELDLAITGGSMVTPKGVTQSDIGIKDGRIAVIVPRGTRVTARETIDATGRHVIPGVIDPEAHPGHTEPWTLDAMTETKAAAAAGVTTWGVQSPSPRFGQEPYRFDGDPELCVSFHEVFDHGRRTFEDVSSIDFFFTFQLETDEQALEIPEYANEYGVTSFKFYGQWRRIDPKQWGVRAHANGLVRGWDDGTFYLALESAAKVGPPGIVAFHPENWEIARIFEDRLRRAGREDIAAWDERSPDFLEADHMRHFAYLAGVVGARAYAQHCTNARSVEQARLAKEQGIELYVQTGPAWLYFTREAWKIMPPLRQASDVDALWAALREGVIDTVGSDHVVARLHRSDAANRSVWSERSSAFGSRVEMLLPVMLHEGVNKGRISLERLVTVLCENPAKIFGLYPRKGSLEIGSDADIVILDLTKEVEVSDEMTWTRSGWTLLDGHVFTGWPVMTILRGQVVAHWPDGGSRMEVADTRAGTYLPRTLDGG